jgi:amidase
MRCVRRRILLRARPPRSIEIEGVASPFLIVWSTLATPPGLPATVMPRAGLPIGMQIIGPFLQDRTTISFAGHAEREFGSFVPPPPSR